MAKKISVWLDAWFGGFGLGRVVSPRSDLTVDVTLDYFIHENTKRWNEKLVRDKFLPF